MIELKDYNRKLRMQFKYKEEETGVPKKKSVVNIQLEEQSEKILRNT